MPRCPRCNCEGNGKNRLVTDSCGHAKCRECLVADVDITDCLECKKEKGAQPQPRPATTTNNHIIATDHGYHCKQCKKDFRSRTQQYYHRSCGNEQLKKFSCPECNRRFATSSHLKYHRNNHINQSDCKCNICNKEFKQPLILQRHLHIHQQEESQEKHCCPDCPSQFRSKSSLSNHMLKHTGDGLPHKCNDCSKRFLTKSNLKQHRQKHDQNSVRHQCKLCPKSFLRQTSLRLHVKRHSKRERHLCSHCCKSYQDADALSRHLKQEHQLSKERYSCRLCDITVNRRDNMLRHLRSIHPGEPFETSVEIVKQASIVLEEEKPEPRYNSVIKSVGNVEPVMVPLNQALQLLPPPQSLPELVHKENVKLYRKIILDLDNEEYSNELSIDEPPLAASSQDTGRRHASSNFSEMHWRKNLQNKCSYESEQTN